MDQGQQSLESYIRDLVRQELAQLGGGAAAAGPQRRRWGWRNAAPRGGQAGAVPPVAMGDGQGGAAGSRDGQPMPGSAALAQAMTAAAPDAALPGAPSAMFQGAAGPAAGGALQAMPAAEPPAPAITGVGGAAMAGMAQEAFAFTHAQLNQAMARNLEKLRTVLQETEQIAGRMEELLSQQARHEWQSASPRGQASHGGGQGGGQGGQEGTRPQRQAPAAAGGERPPRAGR